MDWKRTKISHSCGCGVKVLIDAISTVPNLELDLQLARHAFHSAAKPARSCKELGQRPGLELTIDKTIVVWSSSLTPFHFARDSI